MVVFRSFVTLALAAFVAAGASPSRTSPTLELSLNPPLTAVKALNDGSVEKRSVSEVDTLTNAKRFERGLPPLPPTMHKRGKRTSPAHRFLSFSDLPIAPSQPIRSMLATIPSPLLCQGLIIPTSRVYFPSLQSHKHRLQNSLLDNVVHWRCLIRATRG